MGWRVEDKGDRGREGGKEREGREEGRRGKKKNKNRIPMSTSINYTAYGFVTKDINECLQVLETFICP